MLTPTKFNSEISSYKGTINDKKYSFYGDLGHSGALPDRERKWLDSLGLQTFGEFMSKYSTVIASMSPTVLFDLLDTTSLYQTSAGTTPVTQHDDPVGLVLDKSQMGGKTAAQFISDQPELVTNGNFDTDSDWTKVGSTTISGGVASLDGTSGNALLYQPVLVGNKTYSVSGQGTITAGSLEIIDNSGYVIFSSTSSGDFSFIFTHDDISSNILFRARSGAIFEVDNISIKEIPGQHLVQATASQRPLYQSDGTILTDGVDDKLEATISGFTDECTIAIDFVYRGGTGSYDWAISLNNGGGVSTTELGFFLHENRALGIFNKISNSASSSTNDIGFGALTVGDRVTLVMSANGSQIATSVYKNATLINEVSHSTNVDLPTISQLLLGSSASGAVFGGDRVSGNFGRVAVFASYLNETQRSLVAQWMLEA